MLAILAAVCASLQLPGNGTLLVGPTSPIEVTWSTLPKGVERTFTKRDGYLSLFVMSTEEPTWLEKDGLRYSNIDSSYYLMTSKDFSRDDAIFTAGAEAKVARLDLPLPMPCHIVAVLGRLVGQSEQFTVEPVDYYEDILVCAFPVTYSKDETSDVTVKFDGEQRLAAWTDKVGNARLTCSESKCEFENIPTGDVIIGATRTGSTMEFRKKGPTSYAGSRPCPLTFMNPVLSESESSIGTYGHNTLFMGQSCDWFAWWGILIILLVILAIAGSIVGGIMCCFCGICTCCGCCTCWAAKGDGETVDA